MDRGGVGRSVDKIMIVEVKGSNSDILRTKMDHTLLIQSFKIVLQYSRASWVAQMV